MEFPVKYKMPVYRPPSEARSLLIQLTIGCSHNLCTYCAMYREKSYSVRPVEEVLGEIDQLKAYYQAHGHPGPDKVFLCDGDALAASTEVILSVVGRLNAAFPRLRRISLYATAGNMLEKTTEELREMSSRKLNLAYLGMESGNSRVLKKIVKGASVEDMLEGCAKLRSSGWKLSVIGMLGIGGKELSAEHALDTARVISQISPQFFSLLTTVAIPGTPYAKMVDKKLQEPLSSKEILYELYQILEKMKVTSGCIFRVNHVSNQMQLGGQLPKDQERLTEAAKSWWQSCPEGIFPRVDPSML